MKTKSIALLLIVLIAFGAFSACTTPQVKENPDAKADAEKALEKYLQNTLSGKDNVVIKDNIVFIVEKEGKFYSFNWSGGVIDSGTMLASAQNTPQGYKQDTDKDNIKDIPNNVRVFIPVS
ncbi:MAG: hypothetical protein GX802_04280 [Clostridiales bacterium]|jgi:hypothetical protein|nr:hypothetical protein [Clostridiales bacterium]